MPKQTETKDPREGPKPPFEEPAQPVPGSESKMREKPDHGEGSYRGFGRLYGKAALITGADSDTVGWIERAYLRDVLSGQSRHGAHAAGEGHG